MVQVWLFSFCSIKSHVRRFIDSELPLISSRKHVQNAVFSLYSLIITIWLILNPLASVTSWECCLMSLKQS